MSFPISVLDPFAFPAVTARRVTIVRFARAVTGFADKEAPDLDDRGSTIRAGHGQANGPVVGLIGNAAGVANQTARIRVMRDRVDAAAQLFPELESSADVTMVHPAPGQPLNPADVPAVGGAPERKADCVHLEVASAGAGDPETKLKIRFGSATGPVIAELGVVVYAPKTIFVQVHTVTINGPAHPLTPAPAAPTMPEADIRTIFRRMDRIYTQAGIRVVVRGTILAETVNGYTEQGTVTLTATGDQQNAELQNVLNQNPNANSMNAYIFNQFRDVTQAAPNDLLVLGIAFSRRQANANPPVGAFPLFPGCQAGFTLQATTDLFKAAHTAAHEIGHTLELTHYGGREPQLDEIWSNRNLMKNTVNTFANNAVVKVGYGRFVDGSRRSGSWLGTKAITAGSLSQADQIQIMRTATANGTFRPVARP
ncbi:MAG: zinc-dependent metalloprotease family protein [Bryobacteraceae bacterium]